MKQLKNFFNLSACAMALACGTAISADKPAKAMAAQQTATATTKKSAKKPAKEATEKKAETKLTVYYFHGYARCASCRKIEQYTKEATESFASGEYAGRVSFKAINVEEKPNTHFVSEYQLVSKAVVLQPEKNGQPGKWENLDRIWLELGDKDKFIAYIKAAITKQLEAK